MGKQITIPRSKIQENEVALRGVDLERDDFKGLVSSIRTRGILNPINVRPSGDGETYILVDGLQRFTAAGVVGLDEVPVHVLDTDEDDVLEVQIEANLHRIEMKPIQYTHQLQRIMLKHPERSVEEQARRLSKSVGWLRDRLSLNVFEGQAAELVEGGNIPLSNAYALAKIAKLAPGEVDDWLERAQTLPPEDFIPDALQREKELKAANKGHKPSDTPSGPAQKLRKLGDIKTEYQRAKSSAVNKPTDYNTGYLAAMEWTLTQDSVSVDSWKKAEEERSRQKAERNQEREAEKARKTAEEGKLSLNDLVKLPGPKVK